MLASDEYAAIKADYDLSAATIFRELLPPRGNEIRRSDALFRRRNYQPQLAPNTKSSAVCFVTAPIRNGARCKPGLWKFAIFSQRTPATPSRRDDCLAAAVRVETKTLPGFTLIRDSHEISTGQPLIANTCGCFAASARCGHSVTEVGDADGAGSRRYCILRAVVAEFGAHAVEAGFQFFGAGAVLGIAVEIVAFLGVLFEVE